MANWSQQWHQRYDRPVIHNGGQPGKIASSELSTYTEMIKKEEEQMQEAYAEIGKLYVSVHGNDPEEAFSQWVGQIEQAKSRIAELQQKIQSLKEVRVCPSCGKEVPVEAAFCIFCGTPMPKKPVPSQEDAVKCPHCGAVVRKGAKFCSSCGKPMTEMDPTPPAEPPVRYRFCPKCGAEAKGDTMFCTICGAKIE